MARDMYETVHYAIKCQKYHVISVTNDDWKNPQLWLHIRTYGIAHEISSTIASVPMVYE